jgi:hypothetical protein
MWGSRKSSSDGFYKRRRNIKTGMATRKISPVKKKKDLRYGKGEGDRKKDRKIILGMDDGQGTDEEEEIEVIDLAEEKAQLDKKKAVLEVMLAKANVEICVDCLFL